MLGGAYILSTHCPPSRARGIASNQTLISLDKLSGLSHGWISSSSENDEKSRFDLLFISLLNTSSLANLDLPVLWARSLPPASSLTRPLQVEPSLFIILITPNIKLLIYFNMGLPSLNYRRPNYVSKDDVRRNENGVQFDETVDASLRSGRSGAPPGIPDALAFDKILHGGTCPVSLHKARLHVFRCH